MIRDKYLANKLFEFNGYRGSLQDQTGNGTLTVASAPYWGRKNGRCINFDGINDSLSYGNISNLGSGDWTFDMVISFPVLGNQEYLISKYQNADNRWYIRKNIGGELFMFSKVGGTTVISATSNANFTEASKEYKVTVVGDRTNGLKFYVNGVDETGTITTFDAANLDNTGALAMAKWDVSFGESCNGYTEIYNTAFTPQDVAESFEEWQLSQPYNIVDFRSIEASTGMADGVVPAYIADGKGWNESVANVTSGFLENTNFEVGSGTWQVDDGDGFNKQITCLAPGTAALPFSFVYGTVEFDLYKGAENNETVVTYAGTVNAAWNDAAQTGYRFRFNSSERVALSRLNGGVDTALGYTASSYMVIDTWYSIRITKDTSGVTSMYIKGGAFVDWTLVDVSGGAGSNPVTDNTITTANLFVLNLGALDAIRNINIIPYIK